MHNKLILNAIKLEDCQHRHIYRLSSRNLSFGVFNEELGTFLGIRQKFGDYYLFSEYHHEIDNGFGTVYPKEDVGVLPDHIAIDEHIEHEQGNSWIRKGENLIPCRRRDLRPGEAPHGGRKGFVDERCDTGERTGDNEYPFLRSNDALFDYLTLFKE